MAVLPKAVTSLSVIRNSGDGTGARIEITNWNEVMRTLIKLDKTYVSELRKDFKKIAKPVQLEIKKAIPSKARPPLTNMRQVHFGRLAWGSNFGSGAKPSKSALIQVVNTRARKYRNTDVAIARVLVQSPATVLADMAGRQRGIKGRKGLTPEYDYMYTIGGQKVPGKRRHRVKPGAFLVAMAKASGTLQRQASRFVWPAALKALPAARTQMDLKLTEVNMKLSALLRSK